MFVESETEVPEGATVVFSAHGVAPSVHANARERAARHDRRDLPAGHQGPRRGARSSPPTATRSCSSATPGTRRSRARWARRPTTSCWSQTEEDVDAARGGRPRAGSPTSRRRRCRSTRRARSSTGCASASRRSSAPAPTTSATRRPTARPRSSSSPRECDLVLVIGSRNSSNSQPPGRGRARARRRLAPDRQRAARSTRSGSTASAMVGITSGASAPEELVQRLVEFFRARGTERRPGARGGPGGRPLHAPQGDPPGAWRPELRVVPLRTLVVSDLHLGARGRPDVLRRAHERARAARRSCAGVDRLVLLGDTLELRQGRCATRWRGRAGARELGAALGSARGRARARQPRPRAACAAGSSGRRSDPPLGLESAVDWRAGAARRARRAALAPAPGPGRLPGRLAARGRYATHGHYGDRHTTVPMLERLGAGLTVRADAASRRAARRRAEDYEAALAPMYAWIDAVAQGGGLRGGERRRQLPDRGPGRR